jgi:putative endonuclease
MPFTPLDLKINGIMYYSVYALLSEKANQFYTGYAFNLRERVALHKEGKVVSTKNRGPLRLIYFEGCINQQDAAQREKYLKSGNGKIYLKNRVSNFLNPTG